MLVEPPGPHLPPGHRLTVESALRLGLGVGAVVLAVLSRGDALVLAVVLAAAVWRPLPAAALVAALAASSWRWGSTSLEALAGDQAVLGPAGWVGPTAAAGASWLAALAVLLAATDRLPGGVAPERARHAPDAALARVTDTVRGIRRRDPSPRRGAPRIEAAGALAVALAAGAAAAAVVAGPAPGGDVWVRVLAGVVATALAVGVSVLRTARRRAGRVLDGLSLLAALGALVAVVPDAGRLGGVVDAGTVVEGVAVALAATTIVVTATAAGLAMRDRAA